MSIRHGVMARPAHDHAAWVAAGFVVLAALGATVGLGPLGWLTGAAVVITTCALLDRAMRHAGATTLGPADRVTLSRALLVAAVAALVVEQQDHALPVLVGLAATALALDFVDGVVARRTDTCTPYGARFDMEVDAFLILVLSVQVAFDLGPWVLAIGTMRYLFVLASSVLPWLNEPLPPGLARKAVAAAQGIVLAVAASGVLPRPAAVVGAALVALVWSFSRDIRWLRRNRRRAEASTPPQRGFRHV